MTEASPKLPALLGLPLLAAVSVSSYLGFAWESLMDCLGFNRARPF
jgi:hypothetical protein